MAIFTLDDYQKRADLLMVRGFRGLKMVPEFIKNIDGENNLSNIPGN